MANRSEDKQNDTLGNEDPLQAGLLGKALQLCWLVLSLVLILGLNCLFLVAILRTRKLWRPRFVLPASLCVLDILQGSLFIPSTAINIVSGGRNSTPAWFCWTQACYFYVGSICTLSTLTLMAWDRYQAVCNALHYRHRAELPRLCVKILSVWIVSSAQSLTYIIGVYRSVDITDMDVGEPFCTLSQLSTRGNNEKRYFIIWAICELACIAVICVSYGKVYLETKRHQRQRQFLLSHSRRPDSDNGRGRNLQTERTISAHITVLFVFMIPRYVQIGITLTLASRDQALSVLIVKRAAQFLFLTVPCFSNPVIYGLRSQELQTAVRRVCCCGGGKTDARPSRTAARRADSRSRSEIQDTDLATQTEQSVSGVQSPWYIQLSEINKCAIKRLSQDKEPASVADIDVQADGQGNATFEDITASL